MSAVDEERRNPDSSGEVAAPIARGLEIAEPDAIFASIGAVVDYRGDVTITRKDGATVAGYVFDCIARDDSAKAQVRLLPQDGGAAVSVPMGDIATLSVTGRDTAEGKSFETWVRKYVARMRERGAIE